MMPHSLLDFNIFEDRSLETVIVEFVPRKGNAETWDSRLEALATSGKRVVFRVNYLDPDGIAFILMCHWLRYTPTKAILIETSHLWIQKTLKLALRGVAREYTINVIDHIA